MVTSLGAVKAPGCGVSHEAEAGTGGREDAQVGTDPIATLAD